MSSSSAFDLSVVVVTYDMARELPRTLATLTTPYQHGVDPSRYEIIVVDNGSPRGVDPDMIKALTGPRIRSVRVEDAGPSPAPAANYGLELADADVVGLFIDGARMASPGLLALAQRARRLSDRPVIATLGWHLGAHLHMEAAQHGYDQGREDELLDSVDWRGDGYCLFDISTIAASSRRGYFGPLGESNALFMPRSMWAELGGFDETFSLPGGGLVNHDLYRRACSLPSSDLIVLLGEGTFHQYHGGAFTSGEGDRRAAREEYQLRRGTGFAPLVRDTWYVGGPHQAVGVLDQSVDWLHDAPA